MTQPACGWRLKGATVIAVANAAALGQGRA